MSNSPHLQLCGRWRSDTASDRWLVEPKVDGVRCIIGPLGDQGELVALSRAGRRLPGAQHIIDELKARDFCGVIDGELYFQDWSHTITSLRAADGRLTLFAFDLLTVREWGARKTSRPLLSRKRELARVVCGMSTIQTLAGVEADSTDVCRIAARYRREGYEGAVAKDVSSLYAFGARGRGWYKCKPVDTVDCELVGVVLEGTPHILILTPGGLEQPVYHGLTVEFWEELADWRPGDRIEIRSLGEKWRRGLISPVAVRLRPSDF